MKDGNDQPAQYVFKLTNWSGTEPIYLRGFWPDRGAISHIAIYGVPEPATALLLAMGLGVVAVRKRRQTA